VPIGHSITSSVEYIDGNTVVTYTVYNDPLSPPAISLQVSQLEREVGLPLFERRGRTVSLTMPGEYLLHVTANDLSGPGGGATGCCWRRC
jgi:hypothetical protein